MIDLVFAAIVVIYFQIMLRNYSSALIESKSFAKEMLCYSADKFYCP